MKQEAGKFGQSSDVLKETVVRPVVVDSLVSRFPSGARISLADLGSGDGSACLGVMLAMLEKGYGFDRVALTDIDRSVLGRLVATGILQSEMAREVSMADTRGRAVRNTFLANYGESFDVALAQLVFHQIKSDVRALYLGYFGCRVLKSGGDLIAINLHPKYLEYLARHEKKKFEVDPKGDGLTGRYHHLTRGETTMVYGHSMAEEMSMFLGLGFDPVRVRDIGVEAVAERKERYEIMAENGIPMFYMMQVRKNSAYESSLSEGVVKSAKLVEDDWLRVNFVGGENLLMPKFGGWKKISRGDELILYEVYRPERKVTCLNFWVANQEGGVWGGQLVGRRGRME